MCRERIVNPKKWFRRNGCTYSYLLLSLLCEPKASVETIGQILLKFKHKLHFRPEQKLRRLLWKTLIIINFGRICPILQSFSVWFLASLGLKVLNIPKQLYIEIIKIGKGALRRYFEPKLDMTVSISQFYDHSHRTHTFTVTGQVSSDEVQPLTINIYAGSWKTHFYQTGNRIALRFLFVVWKQVMRLKPS